MEIDNLIIREATTDDEESTLNVEKLAFESNEEANLVYDLLHDNTAKPVLSFLSFSGKKVIGHILFTRVYIDKSEDQPLMHILAPLAVHPDYQNKRIGGLLIENGISRLKTMGSKAVFVLGHESYYPKFGFIKDAQKQGFNPPYPIPNKNAGAWMVQLLAENKEFHFPLKIRCADQLSKPEYWKE